MNKTICIAGYKGKSFFPSKIIRWVTWSDFSHVALMFPSVDGKVYEAWESGVRVTASLSDQHEPFTEVIVKYIRVTGDQHDKILDACISQLGKPYDWTGCFRFSPLARLVMKHAPQYEEQAKWFCSCLLGWCLGRGDVRLLDEAPNKMSPDDVMTSPIPQPLATFICGLSNYSELIKQAKEAV